MIYKYVLIVIVVLTSLLCPVATVAQRSILSTRTPEDQVIPVTGADLFTGCKGDVIGEVNPDFEKAVVVQTNRIRAEHGLPPLKHVVELDESARYHAADMSFQDYFDHNSFDRIDGGLIETCDTWQRIENYYRDWSALAENIAAGQRTPEMAIEGWMNSPDHRHNILSDSYWEIGVGFYEGEGMYRYYWDQNFGKKIGRYPLIVNGEEATTGNAKVTVYIYGNFDRMRLRVNDGEWSQWFKFRSQFEWTLPDRPGEYIIEAEMMGADGHESAQDAIEYIQ